MFRVGDVIIYGKEGVCTVEKIDCMNIPGIDKNKLYYYLSPITGKGTIYTPTDTKTYMRYIISREDALRLIDKIPQIEAPAFASTNIRFLAEHYQQATKEPSCENLVKLLKEINAKKLANLEKGKRLGALDEKYLYNAQKMLYGELSIALDKTIEEIEEILESKLSI